MNTSTELAPFGGLLDSLLDRLAALEKIAHADASASPSTSSPSSSAADLANIATQGSGSISSSSKSSRDDAALIASLQSENADLRTKLENSEKLRERLERQLASAGIKVAEDIPFEVAKEKIRSIAERMQEIGSANVEVEGDKEKQKSLREEYYILELEMEKYNNALLTSDEYIEEGRSKEQQWESEVSEANRLALACIRRHMPVNIKNYSEDQLTTERSPSGKYLPKVIAKKFKRCNVLQLLRMDPKSIARSHPASLENYRINGMTLTERRAVYSHLTESVIDGGQMTIAETWAKNRKDQMVDRKFTWYQMMRDNLKSSLRTYDMHVEQCGPPGEHKCDCIGNSCPVRADRNVINYYDEDYGYPEGDVYQELEQVATVSLSVSPEKMADPSQLSGDRVKEELKNRKRLAYEEWKKTYETEYKIYTERAAVREVKLGELEEQIKECQADEKEYEEEHKTLKRELTMLPRGSRDRLPMMKRVNVAMTQCKEAKRRSAVAKEEMERLKSKIDNEKEFQCSIPKPDWKEDNTEVNSETVSGASASPRPSVKVGFLAAIQRLGQADQEGFVTSIENGSITSNGTVAQNGPESNDLLKDHSEKHDASVSSTKPANDGNSHYAQETSNGHAISAALTPSKDSNKSTRKRSGGQGVRETLLVSCPPPLESPLRPTRSNEEEEEKAKKAELEKKQAAERAERMRREKEALELKMRQQEEEKMKTAAREKARAEAKERSERLRKEKWAREEEEKRQKEEAERLERERQDLLAKQREEEEQARQVAKEAEEKKRSDEDARKKEEQESSRRNKVVELEQHIKECIQEVSQHEETMKQLKKELKEIPRGQSTGKDRVAKMKEINQAQQARGEAKKAAVAAQDELDAYLHEVKKIGLQSPWLCFQGQ